MTDILARFWSKVEIRAARDCWRWVGRMAPNGYGRFDTGRRTVQAHRLAYEISTGCPVVAGKDACHSCDNRWCVNPSHIFPGTRSENMVDARSKGRLAIQRAPSISRKGSGHGQSKLTDDQVREVLDSPVSGKELAAKFGCHKGTISKIRVGRTWRHVPRVAP